MSVLILDCSEPTIRAVVVPERVIVMVSAIFDVWATAEVLKVACTHNKPVWIPWLLAS